MTRQRTAIYARLSREDEGRSESRSVENQVEILSEFAKVHNFDICQIYIDDGYSGATFDRPQFQNLLQDIAEKKFDILLVKDISRLGRSLYKVGELIEKTFPENNIRLISLSDKYDSLKNGNDDSLVIKNFLNDYYLKEFRKKCKNARLHYAQTKHLNYYAKFGYNFDSAGKEMIDERSSQIVKKIFDLIANKNLSTCKVAEILNEESTPTRSYYATEVLGLKPLEKEPAEKWNASKVWEVATDYEYCGHSVNWLKHKNKIILKNTHLAIVDEDLFMRTQKVLKSRSKRKLDHLGKLVVDRKSGRNLLYSKSKISKYFLRDTKTNKRIYSLSAHALEEVIFQDVVDTIKAQKSGADVYRRICGRECDFEKTQRELEKVNVEYSKLLESYFNNVICEEEFNKQASTMLKKIKICENMLNSRQHIESEIDLFGAKFDKFLDRLKDISFDRLRLIRLAVEKVYVEDINKGKIDISIIYKFGK